MAVIKMIFRKMMRNLHMTLNLVFGCVLFIALISSVPLYTDGILQTMLTNELEEFQVARNTYPGSVTVVSDYGLYKGGYEARARVFDRVDNYLNSAFNYDLNLPILKNFVFHQTRSWKIDEDLRQKTVPIREFFFRINYLSDLFENVELTYGRFPSGQVHEGKYEVMISETTKYIRHISLGDEFVISNPRDSESKPIRIVVTGAFRPAIPNELMHLFADISGQNENIFFHEEVFNKLIFENFQINETVWYFAVDYHSINVHNINIILDEINVITNWIQDRGFSSRTPILTLLPEYLTYREELIPLLLSLYTPILIMLLFYLFMISSMVIEKQKNEIAVLKSRGAGRIQLLSAFFIEALLYSSIGLIIGPILGILLTRILGSTTGFLEFVNRTALQIELNHVTYIYASLGAFLTVLAIMIPVIKSTNTEIIEHKKKQSRFYGIPLWKKLFLDVAAIAVSFYGLYRFNLMKQDLELISDQRLSIDPLLFLVSTLFVLGLALFFIRLFPFFIEIIFRAGRKFWPLTVYSSLIQVARSIHTYQFIMLFIIMTVATSIFSVTAARTINQNLHDRVRYMGGAEHILMSQWRVDGVQDTQPSPANMRGIESPDAVPTFQERRYIEPPFEQFAKLNSVETATKVLNAVGSIHLSGAAETVRLMGIEPALFGRTAWFPARLTRQHWFNYLNSISQGHSLVLISRNLAERTNLKLWDVFSMNWDPNGRADFMVAGIIDFWPTWNPNHELDIQNNRFDSIVVANIDYLHANSSLIPYEVWINLRQDATSDQLFNEIVNERIRLERISDIEQDIVALSRDPVKLGVNGSLTLVFIISVVITFAGFMLFWILTVNSRMLQAGVMMAMGIRLRELVVMTVWEQFLTAILPMFYGVVIGGLSATLFIPVLQMSFSAVEQVPPFRTIAYLSDFVNIYLILGGIVIFGLVSVSYILSNLKIYSCIKLGED